MGTYIIDYSHYIILHRPYDLWHMVCFGHALYKVTCLWTIRIFSPYPCRRVKFYQLRPILLSKCFSMSSDMVVKFDHCSFQSMSFKHSSVRMTRSKEIPTILCCICYYVPLRPYKIWLSMAKTHAWKVIEVCQLVRQ